MCWGSVGSERRQYCGGPGKVAVLSLQVRCGLHLGISWLNTAVVEHDLPQQRRFCGGSDAHERCG